MNANGLSKRSSPNEGVDAVRFWLGELRMMSVDCSITCHLFEGPCEERGEAGSGTWWFLGCCS
jgi:hypothetical protein